MKSLFAQTADGILEKVRRGDFTPDAPIPNEFELAALFGVSQGTVRRALKELSDQGVLHRIQGKGTFVTSYGRDMKEIRKRINWFVPDDPVKHAGDPVVKLVFLREEAAAGKTAALLECALGTPVWHLRREIRYPAAEHAAAFEDVYLRRSRFPQLSEALLLEEPRLYEIYELLGERIFTMEDQARAVLLNPEQAESAGVPHPYPAICLQRRSFNYSGGLVELRFLVNVTDEQHMLLQCAQPVPVERS